MSFIDFDIFNPMAPLRMYCSITSTYIFKVKHFPPRICSCRCQRKRCFVGSLPGGAVRIRLRTYLRLQERCRLRLRHRRLPVPNGLDWRPVRQAVSRRKVWSELRAQLQLPERRLVRQHHRLLPVHRRLVWQPVSAEYV